MKKQFQILTTTIILGAIVSCSKETVNDSQTAMPEEISVKNSSAKPVDPLSVNLDGWYTFNNSSLKDKTGKLNDASANSSDLIVFADDRNGKPKSAIYFDGNYGLRIFNVPRQTHSSISLWFKEVNADP